MSAEGQLNTGMVVPMGNIISEYPEVEFTVLTSKSSKLTKSYSIFFGDLKKHGVGLIFDGTAEKFTTTLDKLPEWFGRFTDHQALCHGVADKSPLGITTKGNAILGCIPRSKDYFTYPKGQFALILADYDYSEEGVKIENPEQLLAIIASFFPEVVAAAYVSKPSASSGIYRSDANELITNNLGFHLYWVAEDGSDIPRFIDALFQRLILNGYGHIKISKSGALLIRTVIDGAIKSPERVDFVAPASIGEGLYRKEIPSSMHPGTALNTSLLKSLTKEEQEEYHSMVGHLKEECSREASKVRQRYAQKRSVETGIPVEKIIQMLMCSDNGDLKHDFPLTLNDNQIVTVEEIFQDPRQWNRLSLRDPLSPEDGTDKAMIFCNSDGSVVLHSYAHGGCTYRLWNQPVQLYSDLSYTTMEETEEILKQIGKEVISDLGQKDQVSIL